MARELIILPRFKRDYRSARKHPEFDPKTLAYVFDVVISGGTLPDAARIRSSQASRRRRARYVRGGSGTFTSPSASTTMQMQESRDALLFGLLKQRGIASIWADRPNPQSDLDSECRVLADDPAFRRELSSYVTDNPVIVQSLDTVLAQLAFSAGVHWQQAPEILKPLARRGWHLSRWLPTFLLIDGPLGRLLRERESPLAATLRVRYAELQLLANSRDAFNHDLFRRIRNGFAHWSFTWYDRGSSAQIDIINDETGNHDASISLLEAEALHHLTASVVHSVGEILLRGTPRASGQNYT